MTHVIRALANAGLARLRPMTPTPATRFAFIASRLASLRALPNWAATRRLWLEANAAELNGVSFSKGCYVGQENTARMNWRQKVNRRLVVVPLADADPKRQRVAYPDLGLSVELRRVEDMAG